MSLRFYPLITREGLVILEVDFGLDCVGTLRLFILLCDIVMPDCSYIMVNFAYSLGQTHRHSVVTSSM